MLTSKEVAPIEPGCPHCGRSEPHPHSHSFPPEPTTARSAAAVAKSAAAVAKTVITVKAVSESASKPEPVLRADGKLAYNTWVLHVGHGEMAVTWDKLTQRAQGAWNAVARSCESQTAKYLDAAAQTKK